MDLKQLEYIVAIAENKSLTKAAQQFYISQSALSQQLSKLENELKLKLFVRDKQGFRPTPAGKLYIENAKRIILIRDKTYEELARYSQRQEKSILIGAAAGRSTTLFAHVYPDFKEKYPDYEISLKEGPTQEAERHMDLGMLDMVLTLMMPQELKADSNVNHTCLNREKLILVMPRNHHLVPKDYSAADVYGYTYMDIKMLKNERFILPSKRTKLRMHIDEFFQAHDFEPDIAYDVLSTSAICNLVNMGDLCSVISSGFLSHREDIAFFDLENEMTMEYSISWKKNHRLSEAELYFIELCRKKIREIII